VKIHLAFPVLLMAAACSFPPDVPMSPSPSPLRDAAVGCWQLESSPGLRGRPLEPTLVRLDTATTPFGVMRMHRIPATEPRRDMNRWGIAADGEGVVLSFSSGFSGVVVRATIHGDQLRGRGRTWVDVPSIPRRGRVRGVRVPCPAEPAAR
jgi:hypothetical protein